MAKSPNQAATAGTKARADPSTASTTDAATPNSINMEERDEDLYEQFMLQYCVPQPDDVNGLESVPSEDHAGWICNFPTTHNMQQRRHLQGSGRSDRDAEAFPIIFSISVLCASLLFSIFVIADTCRKSSSPPPTKASEDQAAADSNEDDQTPQPRNSWISEMPAEGRPAPLISEDFTEGNDDGNNDNDGNADPNDNDNDNEETPAPPTLLAWSGVSCCYEVPHKSSSGPTSEVVQTLHNGHGELRSTELLAIMGPSGGGKSTLLDILSGRKSLGTVTGHVSIMGNRVDASDMMKNDNILKAVSAYVPQQEKFFPNQTPEEAVAFFANLKLGPDPRGKHVRDQRIAGLLDLVGLSEEVRRRPIGGALAGGITIRGLSGGERKRLALACGVAMKPKVLFLDEITSGLDSENALIVMKLLKKMCVSLRVAAAVVIHQPSMEVFERFDRLVLLSRGRSIYSDKLSGLPTFYDDVLQHKMPETHHIPTDLLRHASNWECQLSNSAPSDSVPIVNDRHAGRDAKQDSSAGVGEETMSTNGSKSQPPSQHGTSDLPETSPELFTSSRELQAFTAPQVSMFWKFRTVFSRNLQNHYVRNLTNLAARLVIYGSTSLSVSLIFWDIGNIDDDPSTMNEQARYVVGAGLFLSQCSFLLPFSQISTFFFDKSVFASESALALYPSWMYSVSQFLLEAWVLALASLVQTTIAKPMMSLSNPAWSESESFFTLLAFFIISGLTGNALILLTCMVAFSQDLGFLLGCTVVTISLAASGGFVPFAIIPESIRWLQWISPVKYSLQIFIMALFDGTDTTIVQALDLDVPSDITHNILVLIFMFALCAVTTIVTMSFQREVR